MKLIDRISTDPVPYALRVIALVGLLLIVWAVAYAEDVPIGTFSCKDGICVISEQDAQKIVEVFQWLQNRVLELQGKTGCT